MAPPLLTLDDVHLTFGGTPLLEGASLLVSPGDRICLVGRNGSGKSTLMRIAAGTVEPDRGERFLVPSAILRYLPQEADLSGFESVQAYVDAGLGPMDDQHRGRALLGELGLTGDEVPASLSGGEARRAAIARALAPRPDILLLDEPTNHLDLPAIEWLEKEIAVLGAALVVISHDRRFLEALSRTVVWLDRGLTRRLEQGFAAFEEWRDRELDREAEERHKLDRKIAREQEWMHGGVTARRKRNVRRVAELHELRRTAREWRRGEGNVAMAAAEGGQSGRLVIEATRVSKSFGAVPVVRDLSLRVMRRDRIGIVGPNGAGKTTLIKLLTGEMPPDEGTIRLGTGLEMVTLDQKRDELRPTWTVAEALTGGRGDSVVINGVGRHVASYMKDFLFKPEQARTPLSALSGGERGRMMLARALARPSNLLVLDEPTNDLDLETLDLLEEMLAAYQGTVLLVSHDRDFLDRVVTSVVAAEGEGRWIEYAGGYSDMLAQRRGKDLSPGARSAKRETKAAPPSAAAPAEPKRARKLSFKEKHALDTLPGQIAALTGEIKGLEAEIAAPGLYARDARRFDAATRRLAEATAALSVAEEEWLRLEMLREEIEGRP